MVRLKLVVFGEFRDLGLEDRGLDRFFRVFNVFG